MIHYTLFSKTYQFFCHLELTAGVSYHEYQTKRKRRNREGSKDQLIKVKKEEDAITKVEMIVVDKVKDDLQNTDGVNMAGLKRVNEF